jgi:hypothetical protein
MGGGKKDEEEKAKKRYELSPGFNSSNRGIFVPRNHATQQLQTNPPTFVFMFLIMA